MRFARIVAPLSGRILEVPSGAYHSDPESPLQTYGLKAVFHVFGLSLPLGSTSPDLRHNAGCSDTPLVA